jgi:hypothetical protein
MSRQMKVALNLLTMEVDPFSGKEGDIYFNVLTKNLRIHNGNSWIELTPPSTDPTPFYRHTHSFDGEVHTIDIQNPITFLEYNEIASPAVILPEVVGVEGGTPSISNESPSWETLTLFDGGAPGGGGSEDILIIGGDSTDFVGDILDGGASN